MKKHKWMVSFSETNPQYSIRIPIGVGIVFSGNSHFLFAYPISGDTSKSFLLGYVCRQAKMDKIF